MSRAKYMGVISQRGERNEKNIWKTIQNKKKVNAKRDQTRGSP